MCKFSLSSSSPTVAIGGVAYVFLYPLLSGERKAEQRMQSVTKYRTDVARSVARAAEITP